MKKTKISLRFGIIGIMVFLAAFSRLIPHPPNFVPVGAMALFGAAYFKPGYVAVGIPLLAMWLSDLAINNILYVHYFEGFVFFYEGFYWTYLGFLMIVLLGFVLLNKVNALRIVTGTFFAAILFFLVSNFGVWFSGTMYPKSFDGLISCYVAGLPFLRNTLLGNVVYSSLLFSIYELAKIYVPGLCSAYDYRSNNK